MASNHPISNLPYDHQSHTQQYWNSNGQYPPMNNYPKPSSGLYGSGLPLSANVHLDPRAGLNRTPSPTPSEAKELQTGAIDFKAMMNWRFWIRREWLWYYVALVIITVITALITIFHDQIVGWLTPFTQWLHGYVANPHFCLEAKSHGAFKYCCRARGEKMEKTNISYACLAKVVRDGGFKIALIARLSAIPGHFTTAVFSTCGMNVFVFSIAAILSLPKQFITVYLGVILGEAAGQESTKQKLISDGVVAITVIVTIAACWYLLRKMNQVKPDIIYARRKARQAKLNSGSMYSTPNLSGSDIYNPNASETNIPLTAKKNQFGYGAGQSQPYPFSSEYQRSSIGNNIVYAPKPQHRYSPDNQYGNDDPELGHVPPGAAAGSQYNYTPTRQTSDEVGFDAAGQAGVGSAASSQQPSPRIPPGPEVVQTPTQAQFVTYNPSAISSERLPTPGYHSNSTPMSPVGKGAHSPAVSTPTQYVTQAYASQHAYEPTDATYHTAMASSDSVNFPPGGHVHSQEPPPPSYF
ncbi:hypothetical protein HHX47_DHR2000067 [Lentinula edodes]|nr:hypothetical protein HHX47_DHR2000067 [Lentinula edodes]